MPSLVGSEMCIRDRIVALSRMCRAIPRPNRLLWEADQERLKKIHQEKLRGVRSSVDQKKPAKFAHLQSNKKKAQLEEDKALEIERSNKVLLEKMSRILLYGNGLREVFTVNAGNTRAKSLNRSSRKNELIRITEENQALLNRLKETKPFINVEQQLRDREENLKLVRKLCEYPYELTFRTPSSLKGFERAESRREAVSRSYNDTTAHLYNSDDEPNESKNANDVSMSRVMSEKADRGRTGGERSFRIQHGKPGVDKRIPTKLQTCGKLLLMKNQKVGEEPYTFFIFRAEDGENYNLAGKRIKDNQMMLRSLSRKEYEDHVNAAGGKLADFITCITVINDNLEIVRLPEISKNFAEVINQPNVEDLSAPKNVNSTNFDLQAIRETDSSEKRASPAQQQLLLFLFYVYQDQSACWSAAFLVWICLPPSI
eukprot:TRINITY_DN13946_c0_g1_i1.p1 TRINITY_DN13946_c0_g1~~TRINITY_DN13946_c0_g1_i1.p1  ORF type:complete len:428 (+),score=58.54 TRINITY_DN13946_c0_g1_i1:93-1376(+)